MILTELKNNAGQEIKIAKVTVVGHALFVNYDYPPKNCWINLKSKTDLSVKAKRLGIEALLTNFVEEHLPLVNNWGDSEQDYGTALASQVSAIKILVAMNDKHLDVLSRDSDSSVRLAAVFRMSKQNKPLIERDTLLWLDRLVNDPNEWIRREVADIGLPHHLDVLIHDNHPMILNTVADKGQSAHLEKLLSFEDTLTRMKVAANPNATSEQLERLSNDHKECVQMVVAERGCTNKNILTSRFLAVRMAAVEHGCNEADLTLLAHDKSEKVRIALACRGIAHDILYEDESVDVRLAVAQNFARSASNEVLLGDEDEVNEWAKDQRKADALLEKLTKDSDPMVCKYALEAVGEREVNKRIISSQARALIHLS